MRVVGRAKGAAAAAAAKKESGKGWGLSPVTAYKDVFGSGRELVKPICGRCRDRCLSGHYESKKEDLICCIKCFHNDDNNGLKLADDLKLIDNKKMVNNNWSDNETLHLLEGIIAKKNDWTLVSDQARRTKLDCISKLIQLPLGDNALNTVTVKCDDKNVINKRSNELNQLDSNLSKEHETIDGERHVDVDIKEKVEVDKETERSLKRRRVLSWPDATDSLMKQVANVSTVAGPHIAATATKAAITALCSESPYARKVFKINDEFGNKLSAEPDSCSAHMDVEKPETEEQSESEPESGMLKNFGHLAFTLRASIATAFGSLAARAKMLADQEDREIEQLVASIIQTQVRKLQCKIRYFDELEFIMEKEYVQMKELKESILSEIIDLLQKANSAGITNWRGKGLSKPFHGHT